MNPPLRLISIILLAGTLAYAQIIRIDGQGEDDWSNFDEDNGGDGGGDDGDGDGNCGCGKSNCDTRTEIACASDLEGPGLCKDDICKVIRKCVPKKDDGVDSWYCPPTPKCAPTPTKLGFSQIACTDLLALLYQYFDCNCDLIKDPSSCKVNEYICCKEKNQLIAEILAYRLYLIARGDPTNCLGPLQSSIDKAKADAVANCCYGIPTCLTNEPCPPCE